MKLFIQKTLGTGNNSSLPAIIKDPFRKEAISSINLYWSSSDWSGGWNGSVTFTNGKTSGKQDLVGSESLDDIVAQIKAIMESIKDKP